MPQAYDRALDDVVQENFQKRKQNRIQQNRQFSGNFRASFRPRAPYQQRSHPYVGKFQQRPGFRHPRAMYNRQPYQNVSQPLISTAQTTLNEQIEDSLTKILISNLEFGVTVEDVKELFGEFGKIMRSVVNYDKSGRSLGTAEVTFANRGEAIRALQHYNGVPLDGKPMSIEIVANPSVLKARQQMPMHRRVGPMNQVRQPAPRASITGNYVRPQQERPFPSHLAFQRRHNVYRPRYIAQQPTDKRVQTTDGKTAEELDKELDKYLVEQAKAKGL